MVCNDSSCSWWSVVQGRLWRRVGQGKWREKWDQGSASLTRATDLPAATLPTLRIQMSTRVRICKVPKKRELIKGPALHFVQLLST